MPWAGFSSINKYLANNCSRSSWGVSIIEQALTLSWLCSPAQSRLLILGGCFLLLLLQFQTQAMSPLEAKESWNSLCLSGTVYYIIKSVKKKQTVSCNNRDYEEMNIPLICIVVRINQNEAEWLKNTSMEKHGSAFIHHAAGKEM